MKLTAITLGCLALDPGLSQAAYQGMPDMRPERDREEFSFREEVPAYSTGTLRATKSLRDHAGFPYPVRVIQ
jgi:hypothetical protein